MDGPEVIANNKPLRSRNAHDVAVGISRSIIANSLEEILSTCRRRGASSISQQKEITISYQARPMRSKRTALNGFESDIAFGTKSVTIKILLIPKIKTGK
jgi:hypothetical protein